MEHRSPLAKKSTGRRSQKANEADLMLKEINFRFFFDFFPGGSTSSARQKTSVSLKYSGFINNSFTKLRLTMAKDAYFRASQTIDIDVSNGLNTCARTHLSTITPGSQRLVYFRVLPVFFVFTSVERVLYV